MSKMRTYCRLILLASLMLLCGCVRERTDGDTVVLNFRWWAMLWGFGVPLLLFGAILAQHTRTWINGKWIPWWRFYGWDAYEWGYAAGAIVICGIGFATIFDRLEVTPTYMRESSLSPWRGLRRVVFSDIQRIELPPQEEGGFVPSLKNRRKKKPPAMHIVFKDGRQEDFDGWLVRHMQSTILERAAGWGCGQHPGATA